MLENLEASPSIAKHRQASPSMLEESPSLPENPQAYVNVNLILEKMAKESVSRIWKNGPEEEGSIGS